MSTVKDLKNKIKKVNDQLEFVKEMERFDMNNFYQSKRDWRRIKSSLKEEIFILQGAVWALLEAELDDKETFKKESE